eukprot:3934776-Rhodomonas_salina.2
MTSTHTSTHRQRSRIFPFPSPPFPCSSSANPEALGPKQLSRAGFSRKRTQPKPRKEKGQHPRSSPPPCLCVSPWLLLGGQVRITTMQGSRSLLLIVLIVRYVMISADRGDAASRRGSVPSDRPTPHHFPPHHLRQVSRPPYAPARLCPVLTSRLVLPAPPHGSAQPPHARSVSCALALRCPVLTKCMLPAAPMMMHPHHRPGLACHDIASACCHLQTRAVRMPGPDLAHAATCLCNVW